MATSTVTALSYVPRIGWSNIGDEELLVLADAVRSNRRLRELW